jgi:phosphoribosylformimino-5-aminoimidazole carboxamide ribotide isomerase
MLYPTNTATARPTTSNGSMVGLRTGPCISALLVRRRAGFFRRRDEASPMFSSFEVVPAVDMQDGQVVQLVGGERGTGTEYGDPVESAWRWVDEGAETLHLVDLDGAFEGERKNAPAVEAVLEAVDVDVQLGGGIRTARDACSLLDRGVDRVILGTAAVENPNIVGAVSEDFPGSVMVSLDAKDGEVVVSGWTEGTGLDPADAAARYEEEGAGAVLFTDVDVEGQLEGVRREPVKRVVEAVDVPVVASGGVSSLDDVRALKEVGAAAVVVGTALYEGRFTLEEANAL